MQKTLLIILIVIFFGCKQKSSQEVCNSDEPKATEAKDWKQHFAEMEINALKKPYRGIFTEDETYENLFPIQVTGVTTKPIVDAARTFLSSLNTDQLMRIRFDINNEENLLRILKGEQIGTVVEKL